MNTIILTRDTHQSDYLETQEGKNLPVEHCIEKTLGWQLIDEVKKVLETTPNIIIDKETFGSIYHLSKTIKDLLIKGQKRFLVVVDMQNDFVSMNLGSKYAKDIVDEVIAKIEWYKNLPYDFSGSPHIELVGLCTDICVVSNALILKATFPEMLIIVDSSCCAGVTPEKHEAALETMRSCQVTVI